MILQAAYIGLSVAMTLILILIGFRAIVASFSGQDARRKKIYLVLGLLVWHVYTYVITSFGYLQDFSFPPKFFVLVILPAFIFTGIFIYRNRKNDWIQNIPKQWLFFYQSFRILIESIFVMSVAKGVLHYHVTIQGYNFDMIYAVSILVVGFLIFGKRMLNLKVALAWNYLGLLVIASIIFVFQSTIYLPELYGASSPLMPLKALSYPYVLVAGFLMPTAVFIHVLSIVQLKQLIKEEANRP